jgi:hypothetical protein
LRTLASDDHARMMTHARRVARKHARSRCRGNDQAGETPALITLIALTRPAIRLP